METLLEDLYGPMLRFLQMTDVGRMAQMSRTWEYHCHHVEDYRSHLDFMISIYELHAWVNEMADRRRALENGETCDSGLAQGLVRE